MHRKGMIFLRAIVKKFVCIVLLLLLFTYMVLLISVFPLLREVKSVFLGAVPSSETAGTPIAQYNRYGEYTEQGGIARTNLFFLPYFTLHDFQKVGYIWILYSVEGYNSDGDLLYGTWLSSAKWEIKKTEKGWIITGITEAP